MQILRVAVGIVGVFDMLYFGALIIRLSVCWGALAEHDENLESLLVALIIIATFFTMVSAGLLSASHSNSRIHAQGYCNLWLCFNLTLACVETPLIYYVLDTFDINTFIILYIIDIVYRKIAVVLVIQYLKKLRWEIFAAEPDEASTAQTMVPRNRLV